MKCPVCGAAELIHDTRNLPYTYKGETTIIPSVTADFCPACGEVILNREHGDRYSELLRQFQRQVNAAYVDPGFITSESKSVSDLSVEIPLTVFIAEPIVERLITNPREGDTPADVAARQHYLDTITGVDGQINKKNP